MAETKKVGTIKKTFKELSELDGIVGSLYQKDPTLRDTKFGYAYKRFYEINIAPVIKQFQEQLNDARIDNALEDETTKAIITDKDNTRGFKYSKEGLKAVIKAEQKITEKFDVKEIEVDPFISVYVPDNLTETQTEALKGILI